MKTAEFKIENGEATLYFNGMLEKTDFDQFWEGNGEARDGSSGSMSETIQEIYDITEKHSIDSRGIDFQVWGPDPSFASHIDPAQVPAMVKELIAAFPNLEIEYLGKTVDDLLEKWIVVNFGTEVEDRIRVTQRNNFAKTVVSEANFGDPDCTDLDEAEQIEILLQMPETAPHIEGTTSEETENFIFRFDLWATNPWFCFVERK